MFSRALALLAKIQERLALDRGSALSRALAESKAATSNTEKPGASTESHSTPAGSSKTQLAGQHPSSIPAQAANRRKQKPAPSASAVKKRTAGKASARTPTAKRSGKTGG